MGKGLHDDRAMPLLRITCPAGRTDVIVALLESGAAARDVPVVPGGVGGERSAGLI